MQGSKSLALGLSLLALAACSPKSILTPDCHSCTVEEQEWDAFGWQALNGSWKGSLETYANDKASNKKSKQEKKVELRFLTAAQFLQAQGTAACGSLPADAIVMNGMLWETAKDAKAEYDAFVPVEKNNVAYGRLTVEKVNGQKICGFRRLGRVMGKNRLDLPAVTFSENSSVPGRQIASADGSEAELSLEFLRFAPAEAKPIAFQTDGRRPSSVKVQEKPPLMIRVFRSSSKAAGERGEWKASQEQLYRLWKAD